MNILKAIDESTSGCRNIMDSFHFVNTFINNPEFENVKEYSNSMVYGREYTNCVGMLTMLKLLEKVFYCQYREEGNEIIDNNKQYLSNIQRKSLTRILENKPYKPTEYENSLQNISINKISKCCPHCGVYNLGDIDKSYAICGFNDDNKGYDWIGCGNDWCFKCGKKLCKNWMKDFLFDPEKRYHNGFCCKEKANNKNENYEENYCLCEDL
jgi:hypothetical protein